MMKFGTSGWWAIIADEFTFAGSAGPIELASGDIQWNQITHDIPHLRITQALEINLNSLARVHLL